jgi:mucin-like protein
MMMTFVRLVRHGDASSLVAGLRRMAGGVAALAAVAAVCVFAQAQPAQAQAAACPPGEGCPCTWSAWLDRDDPGGVGDFETLADLVKEGKIKCRRPLAVQCRYKGGALWGYMVASYTMPPTPPPGYTCITNQGGICTNSKTKPPGTQSNPSCKDSEVRFCCLPE